MLLTHETQRADAIQRIYNQFSDPGSCLIFLVLFKCVIDITTFHDVPSFPIEREETGKKTRLSAVFVRVCMLAEGVAGEDV